MNKEEWEAFYGRCWDILVEHAGANDHNGHDRTAFIYHMIKNSDWGDCQEYRFCGALGFGGKFRRNGNQNNTVHVDCYLEDSCTKTDKMVEKTNRLLKEAQQEMVGGPVFGCPERHDKYVAFMQQVKGA